MWDWIRSHEQVLLGLGIFSVVCFVVSLLAIPWLIARIPADYFAHRERVPPPAGQRHPALRLGLLVLKNALGVLLVVAGIAMLILPGQGILTVLVGVLLLNFPGKYALEKRLVGQPRVLAALNWIRQKAGRPPLQVGT